MKYAYATEKDFDLLAEWNFQLIRDEGHRNSMSVAELRQRMGGWLEGEYRAVIFRIEEEPLAYALFREDESEIYLRQFFMVRDRRRAGIGRKAMAILRDQLWSKQKRLVVEVLTDNQEALNFWRSIGYKDYALTLEIMPEA